MLCNAVTEIFHAAWHDMIADLRTVIRNNSHNFWKMKLSLAMVGWMWLVRKLCLHCVPAHQVELEAQP